MRTIANVGAYLSNYAPSNSTMVGSLAGPYDIPAAHVEVTGVFTNTVHQWTPTAALVGPKSSIRLNVLLMQRL